MKLLNPNHIMEPITLLDSFLQHTQALPFMILKMLYPSLPTNNPFPNPGFIYFYFIYFFLLEFRRRIITPGNLSSSNAKLIQRAFLTVQFSPFNVFINSIFNIE